MLTRVLREVERKGGRTRAIHLADYQIFPPSGKLDRRVSIEHTRDDMPKLQRLVLEADGIVFATPAHWFNMSAHLKLFLDRLTSLEHHSFLLEGKAAGFVIYGPQGGAMSATMLLLTIVNQMGMIFPPYAAIVDEGRGDKWSRREEYRMLTKNMLQLIRAGKEMKFNWGYPGEPYEMSPIELLKKKK